MLFGCRRGSPPAIDQPRSHHANYDEANKFDQTIESQPRYITGHYEVGKTDYDRLKISEAPRLPENEGKNEKKDPDPRLGLVH